MRRWSYDEPTEEFSFFNKNDTGEIVWTIYRDTGYQLFPFQVQMLNRLLEHHNVISCRGAGRSLIVKGIAQYYAEKEHRGELRKLIVKALDWNDYTKPADDVFNWNNLVENDLVDGRWLESMRTRMPSDVWKREYCCSYTPMSKDQIECMVHHDDTFILIQKKCEPLLEFF